MFESVGLLSCKVNIITVDITEPGMLIMSLCLMKMVIYPHRTGNVINFPGRHNDSTAEVCIPGIEII